MKKLFFVLAVVLAVASVYSWTSLSEQQTERPVINWKSDANPTRYEQIDLFHVWMIRKGREKTVPLDGSGPFAAAPDGSIPAGPDGKPALREGARYFVDRTGRYGVDADDKPIACWQNQYFTTDGTKVSRRIPDAVLNLDAANNQSSLIQAVSGVGGDVIDAQVQQFAPMGVTKPLDEMAKGTDFHYTKTYAGAQELLLGDDGVQYGYPCNLAVAALLFNRVALEQAGIAEIPEEWTPEEFERIGKQYVDRMNEGLTRRKFFFNGSALDTGHGDNFITFIIRSQGHDLYNETLTATQADDPRYIAAAKRLYKWTNEDHLFPNAAEIASVNTESGYGGSAFSQFQAGNYASILIGRYALIRFREFNQYQEKLRLTFVLPPMYDFKNLTITSRTAILYSGTRYPDLARLFFEYLADREYNTTIIDSADGLPPNPVFALDNPNYLRPPEYPNEGNVHENELKWAITIAIPGARSPYFKGTTQNWIVYALSKYFNGRATVEDAFREAQERYAQSIQDTLTANPHQREEWERNSRLQKEIDRLKAEDKPIPASWLKNPFHLAYYRYLGKVREDRPEPTASADDQDKPAAYVAHASAASEGETVKP